MITQEQVSRLTARMQTSEQNVIREYCQHLFLSHFYQRPNAEKVLFKGGTAIKIVLRGVRFSEDLDFSAVSNITIKEVESLFGDTLAEIAKGGIITDFDESKSTTGGYLGIAKFIINGYAPIKISIEVSFRDVNKPVQPSPSVISSDFISTYTLFHLPQSILVREKIDATLSRGTPRDFYDIYFILRSNLIDASDKKSVLSSVKDILLKSQIDFKGELREFLPLGQQQIISNFKDVLIQEIDRHLGN